MLMLTTSREASTAAPTPSATLASSPAWRSSYWIIARSGRRSRPSMRRSRWRGNQVSDLTQSDAHELKLASFTSKSITAHKSWRISMVKTLAVMAPAQKQRAPAKTGSVKHVLTMTEKILARASERLKLDPGENVWVNVDVLMTHDICGPRTFGIFKQEFGENAKALSSSALSVIGDRYYKVTADALRVCEELVRVIRPTNEMCTLDFKPYIQPIYNTILTRLANQDQDQVIARQSIDKYGHCELQDSNVEKMLCFLFNHCESEEEGVHNVVAECLGKIALLE